MLVPFKRVFEARKAVDAAFAASAADGKSTDQASSRTDAAVALLRASDELYKSNGTTFLSVVGASQFAS